MITLTDSAKKRLGQRASQYIEDKATQWMLAGERGQRRGRPALCPVHKASDAVRHTIGRVYGSPATIDRGETEYWEIPAADFAPEET
jgi:hypothetical protein